VKRQLGAAVDDLLRDQIISIGTIDHLDHNWGQRGAMEVNALVKKSGEVASGAM